MFVSAATAVTLTLAEPLTAAVLGVVVLDERLNQTAGFGCGLVLAGLLLLTVPDGGNKGRS
jgi:DME family drug/metabolite transporter